MKALYVLVLGVFALAILAMSRIALTVVANVLGNAIGLH